LSSAAGLVTNIRKYYHIKMLLLTYKYINDMAPEYLRELCPLENYPANSSQPVRYYYRCLCFGSSVCVCVCVCVCVLACVCWCVRACLEGIQSVLPWRNSNFSSIRHFFIVIFKVIRNVIEINREDHIEKQYLRMISKNYWHVFLLNIGIALCDML